MKRFFSPLFAGLGLILLLGLLAGHAAAETPAATSAPQVAVAAADTAWDLLEQHGPIWGGMLLVFGVATAFLKRNTNEHWLKQGRVLAIAVGAVGVLGSVLEAGVNGGTWAGVVITAITAIKLVLSPTVGAPTSAKPALPVSLVALLVGVVAIAPIASCTHDTRRDTIHAALVATDTAHAGFVEWDRAHQIELVERATSREDGEAALSTYRAKRGELVTKLVGVYRALAAAAIANDDQSLAALLAAADQMHQALVALTGGKIP